MIGRLWLGWTVPENADACQDLLRGRIMPEIHRDAGTDHEAAVAPPEARTLLARFDQGSIHCETLIPPERGEMTWQNPRRGRSARSRGPI